MACNIVLLNSSKSVVNLKSVCCVLKQVSGVFVCEKLLELLSLCCRCLVQIVVGLIRLDLDLL